MHNVYLYDFHVWGSTVILFSPTGRSISELLKEYEIPEIIGVTDSLLDLFCRLKKPFGNMSYELIRLIDINFIAPMP